MPSNQLSLRTLLCLALVVSGMGWSTNAPKATTLSTITSTTRRGFLTSAFGLVGASVAAASSSPALAAPEIFTTANGKIKYATLKQARDSKTTPRNGDIVAIEYTGYLSDGTIFDATHAEGKKNVLMFQVGGNAVISGVSEMVEEMGVGQKVQAIIPPELAFGDKGLCLETGECLIKPGSTLVYDIYLKQSAIPPP
ncbi:hypothetical protein ACA910_005587 [Epithemia clementina (nom. ined.)]